MVEQKSVILIIEDDLDVAEMLDAYFRVQGYEVLTANWGEDGVAICQKQHPDLIILDIRLPDIDGFEVAARVRENRRTANIPIIFLTEKRSRSDVLQGLELGADDYITKPFDIQELRLRVRNSLQRSSLGAVTNPVTNLPEGLLVDERLNDCVSTGDWAIMLISLQNLDVFREDYGFVASDDVLRAVSLMVQNALKKIGNPNDFVGHFSASEFLVISTPEAVVALEGKIRSRLDQSLDYFYPLRDRETPEDTSKRLKVQIAGLLPGKEPFKNLDHLKTTLIRRRK